MLLGKFGLSDEEIATKLGTMIQRRAKKWRLRSAMFNPFTQLPRNPWRVEVQYTFSSSAGSVEVY